MAEIHLDKVDRTITLQHSTQDVTLEHSKWNIYIATIMLGYGRMETYIRVQYKGKLC